MAVAVDDGDSLDAPNYALFNLLLRTGDGDEGGKQASSKSLLRAKAKVVCEWTAHSALYVFSSFC